jgi:hypothetical protein
MKKLPREKNPMLWVTPKPLEVARIASITEAGTGLAWERTGHSASRRVKAAEDMERFDKR